MSKKLQNIKAIKQMMSGDHKSQKKQQIFTGKIKSTPNDHEVIEKFDNGKPKVWIERDEAGFGTRVTQHDGFRAREPENSILKDIKDALKVPEKCPSCNTKMRNEEQRLNFKFYFLHKKCFSCVVKEETLIRQKGQDAWEEYENKIMLGNAEGWFKDADKEVEVLKQQIFRTWQNASGEYAEADMTAFIKKMELDYSKLKEKIRKQFVEE